jgi:hypothetical protein
LGHAEQIFDGQKVGPWAATLDELARELDILILVAAGNRKSLGAEFKEEWVTGYPHIRSRVRVSSRYPSSTPFRHSGFGF